MKFRKKPVVIDAVQWTGTNFDEIYGFTKGSKRVVFISAVNENDLIVVTLEGDMTANVGDWIIKGVKGEVYPCKPDIFEKTYERI